MIGNRIDDEDWEITHSYDRSTERPSEVVTRAVAGTTDRNVFAMEPLYGAVDPDALDAIVAANDRSNASLSFRYEGCDVYVDGGEIAVSAVRQVE